MMNDIFIACIYVFLSKLLYLVDIFLISNNKKGCQSSEIFCTVIEPLNIQLI